MLHTLSKLVSVSLQPLTWVATVLLVGVVLLSLRSRRPQVWGRNLCVTATVLLFFLGWQALPDTLVRGLEEQHEPPSTNLSGYAGMVVLGGVFRLPDGRGHDLPALGRGADRIVAPLPLLRRYPQMRIVFTGGDGSLFNPGEAEAEVAKVFLAAMGVDMSRVLFESRSRNTYENATFSRDVPGVDIRQRWLLVTSASHMPRALATFQKAGWNVAPYPVDYYSSHETQWLSYSLMRGIGAWETVLYEYVAMAAYRLAGRL